MIAAGICSCSNIKCSAARESSSFDVCRYKNCQWQAVALVTPFVGVPLYDLSVSGALKTFTNTGTVSGNGVARQFRSD